MIPNKPKLSFGLVQKSPFDFLPIKLSVIFEKMIKVCRTSDLQKVWKVPGDLDDASRITGERHSCFCRGPGYKFNGLGAGKRAQKNVRKNIEKRRIGDQLGVTQLLKVTRRACHICDVVIV